MEGQFWGKCATLPVGGLAGGIFPRHVWGHMGEIRKQSHVQVAQTALEQHAEALRRIALRTDHD